MRKLRLLADGVWYEVRTSVNNREPLFWVARERARFERVLCGAREIYVFEVRDQRIRQTGDVTPSAVMKLQNALLAQNLKPCTVNRLPGCVKAVFDHMLMDGTASANPFRTAVPLKTRTGGRTCFASLSTVQGCATAKSGAYASTILYK
jgi:hypothetical protein